MPEFLAALTSTEVGDGGVYGDVTVRYVGRRADFHNRVAVLNLANDIFEMIHDLHCVSIHAGIHVVYSDENWDYSHEMQSWEEDLFIEDFRSVPFMRHFRITFFAKYEDNEE